MNKLEMAHQYFMQTMGFIRNNDIDHNFDDVVSESWDYADAMQAEADKREKQKAIDGAESSKVLFEKLTDSRSLTKDEHGNCLHFHHEFGHKKCMDCGACLDGWQPDWRQAPENMTHFAVDANGSGWFFNREPHTESDNCWYCGDDSVELIGHNYKGPWQDSLRKFP